jgi:uncharacterized damage-inducible protein DinB
MARLETQLEALSAILARATPDTIDQRPSSGDWSARENLAHLARHHSVFHDRLERLLAEDRPQLGRYRAEEDPKWPEWSRLPLDEIVERLRSLRRRLVERVRSLTPAQVARTALHPTFGEMGLSEWLDFFLLHEAHHLYTAMICIGATRLHRDSSTRIDSSNRRGS